MNSRILWGIIISIVGLVLIIIGLVVGLIVNQEVFFLLYHGIVVLIVGILIFFNKKEDKIEQIKSNKKIKKGGKTIYK